MKQAISWKTTVCGVLAAVAAFVAASPETFAAWPWLIVLAKFAMAGGLAGIGIVAKDYNVRTAGPPYPPPPEPTVTVDHPHDVSGK